MSVRPAALIYRCRACGVVHHPMFTVDGPRTLDALLGGVPMAPEWKGRPPRLVEPHECNGRTWGVSDFIGIEFQATPDDDAIPPNGEAGPCRTT